MIVAAVRALVWVLRRAPHAARRVARRGGKYRAGMLAAEAVAAVALTLLVHELGHAAIAAFVFRLPVAPVFGLAHLRRGGLVGFRIGSNDRRLTRIQIVCTAIAGPAANVALVAGAYWAGYGILVPMGLVFAAVNLIPFKHSDGDRILHGYRDAKAAK